MKKKTVTAVAIAAVLIVAGFGLAAVAFEMGGGARQLFNSAMGSLPRDELSGDIGSWSCGDEHSAKVDSIVVNWISGSVVIEAADVDEVSFSESASRTLEGDEMLTYRIVKDTLYIDYCREKNTIGIFGDGFDMPAKQLKITVPLEMASISIDTTSADVALTGVEAERLHVETTSGNIIAQEISAINVRMDSTSGDIDFNGVASELGAQSTSGKITFIGSTGDFDAESTSGDISFEGSAKGFSADTTSGSVHGRFADLPAELEAETVSGDVALILPADSGFELEFDTVSGGFDCEFAVKMYDGEYIVGNGGAEISVSTVSGGCKVKKN